MRTLPERLIVRNLTFYCRMRVPRDLARIFGRQLVVFLLAEKRFLKLARRHAIE